MLLLSLQNVRKHFGPDPVLDGVTFDLRKGERAALVGPNGAGKTTLMRIIAGDEEPDGGNLERTNNVRIGYLQQQPDFPPGNTVWDEARSALAHLFELVQEAESLAHRIGETKDEQEHRKLGQ